MQRLAVLLGGEGCVEQEYNVVEGLESCCAVHRFEDCVAHEAMTANVLGGSVELY